MNPQKIDLSAIQSEEFLTALQPPSAELGEAESMTFAGSVRAEFGRFREMAAVLAAETHEEIIFNDDSTCTIYGLCYEGDSLYGQFPQTAEHASPEETEILANELEEYEEDEIEEMVAELEKGPMIILSKDFRIPFADSPGDIVEAQMRDFDKLESSDFHCYAPEDERSRLILKALGDCRLTSGDRELYLECEPETLSISFHGYIETNQCGLIMEWKNRYYEFDIDSGMVNTEDELGIESTRPATIFDAEMAGQVIRELIDWGYGQLGKTKN